MMTADAMERRPLDRDYLEYARREASRRQREEKKYSQDELDAAISKAWAQAWNSGVDAALEAYDRSLTRLDFLNALDGLGWTHD